MGEAGGLHVAPRGAEERDGESVPGAPPEVALGLRGDGRVDAQRPEPDGREEDEGDHRRADEERDADALPVGAARGGVLAGGDRLRDERIDAHRAAHRDDRERVVDAATDARAADGRGAEPADHDVVDDGHELDADESPDDGQGKPNQRAQLLGKAPRHEARSIAAPERPVSRAKFSCRPDDSGPAFTGRRV